LGVDDDLEFFPTSSLRKPKRVYPKQVPPLNPEGDATGSVLLLDLENVCSTSRDPERTHRELSAILTAAGPVDKVIAVACRDVVMRQKPVLRSLKIDYRTVPCGKDAADKALLKAAKSLRKSGTGTFFIASCDHYFKHLAWLGKVVVVTPPGNPVAKSLVEVASRVLIAS
jgi:hypothetical protein